MAPDAALWRAKLWKFRFLLLASLLFSLLLASQYLFHPDVAVVNPFRMKPAPEHAQTLVLPPTTPSVIASSPPSPASGNFADSTQGAIVAAASPAPVSIFNLQDFDFDGQYVGWPFERLCTETTWTPGLTFTCDNNSGGIGNIRNFVLTCVRYAIDAGASQILLPKIQRRSDEDLANIFTTSFQPFDYFFDEKHFRSSIDTFCPQIKIYNTLEEVPYADNLLKIEDFYPKDLGDLDGCDGRGVNRHLDLFRDKFDTWLRTTQHTPNATNPISIRFRWATFFEWPIYRDGPEFAATFGSILQVRQDIQALAAKALKDLSSVVGVEANGGSLNVPFLGVHLRTESDALDFWPNFDVQTQGYIAQAQSRNLKHVYLACGNATDAKRFIDQASEEGKLSVTTKYELLKEQDLRDLNALSWDQQALVDYLILTKSTHFTGCSFSSFTMNIAFKRHLMTGGIQSRPWKSPGDHYTTLIGRFDYWFGDWMFMYECMWP